MQARALDIAEALSPTGEAACYGSTGEGFMPIARAVAEDRCYSTHIRSDLVVWESDHEDDRVFEWLEFEGLLCGYPPLVELSRGDGSKRCHVYFKPGSDREAQWLEKAAQELDVVPKSPMVRPPGTLYKDGSRRSVVVGDVPDWVGQLGPAPAPPKTVPITEPGPESDVDISRDVLPEFVREILETDWTGTGMRSDKMIEAENGMLHLPADHRYAHLRTNPSFCEKMDARGGQKTGWEFYSGYIQAKGDLHTPFIEQKGGTAPKTPRELLKNRHVAVVMIDWLQRHPQDYITQTILLDAYGQALKHGDLKSAGLAPRDEFRARGEWLDQRAHSDFLHRKYHPLYEVISIGTAGQKSVANLLTKQVEHIVATYDRHHRTEGFLKTYAPLDPRDPIDPLDPEPGAEAEEAEVEGDEIEDEEGRGPRSPYEAWTWMLRALREARMNKRYREATYWQARIDSCLPTKTIRVSTWSAERRDRTPLGVTNDYQLARHLWVRVRRTNAYTEIVNLPSVEDFVQWDQEATDIQDQRRLQRREYQPLGSHTFRFHASREERLAQLKQMQATRHKQMQATPTPHTVGINRTRHIRTQVYDPRPDPSRAPPSPVRWSKRIAELKEKTRRPAVAQSGGSHVA